MRVAKVIVLLLLSAVTGKATDFLTEGVDNGRTGWVRDEKVFTPANVGSMKLLWKVKLESTPRAMHNLFAPLVAERVTTAQGTRELAVVAGVSDDLFGIDVATGKQIWHRHFDSTLANPGGTNDTLCPGGQTAVPTMAQASPGKYTVYAVSWDGRLRQVNLADGTGRRAAREVHPRRRQAVRAQPAQRRDLHGDRAGLRRPDERVLFVRSRHPPRQRVHPRRRRPVGPPRRVDRSRRHGLPRHRRRAVRSADPAARQRHRRREARRQEAAAARRLLRRAERELAVAARSRRQHDAGGRSTIAAASSSSARARNAGCGCSIATRSAARIIGRRCTPRRSSATTRRRSTRKGIWGALSAWQDEKGTQWVLAPFWGPVSKEFKAPIEHARPDGRRRRRVQAAKSARASGSSRRRGCRATWISPRKRSSPTASCSPMRPARTRRRWCRIVAWDETGRAGLRRRAQLGPGAPRSDVAARRALRARRADRQGTVVERQPDRILEPLQRPDGRERPRLHRDVRRRPLLLRRRQVGGGT